MSETSHQECCPGKAQGDDVLNSSVYICFDAKWIGSAFTPSSRVESVEDSLEANELCEQAGNARQLVHSG